MLQGTEGLLGLGATELRASCRYLQRATSSYISLQNDSVFGEYFVSAAFYSELINYIKLKEIVYQKFKFAEIVLKAIQDVDEFVSSSEQIWRNLALHHLLTNGSSAVNGCRQNESPNRADKSTAPLLMKRKGVFVIKIKKWRRHF